MLQNLPLSFSSSSGRGDAPAFRLRFFSALLLALAFAGAPSAIAPLLPSDACAGLEAQARRKKNTQDPATENYEKGLRLMREEDLDGAIDAFLQATYFARNNYYPMAHYWLGICYMDKNEDDKALASLTTATKQTVEPIGDAHLAMAEIHLRHDRYEDCQKEVNNASMCKDVTMQQCQYIFGLVNERRGKLGAAETCFNYALGDKPWKWTKAWMKYAETLMKEKKWAPALVQFRDMLKSSEPLKGLKEDRVHLDMGVCCLAIGDHQGALDNWFRSLDYNQENAEVWLQIGMLLEAEKHYSSAVKKYKEFIRLKEDAPDPRVQQVKDRINRIEQMLKPNEVLPQQAKPSPYMRQQLQQSQQMQQRQQLQQRPTGDSGF